MLNHPRSCACAFAALAAALLASGCSDRGPARGTVTGIVTLDGEPLAGAEVVFQPEDGSPSSARTDIEGRYELMYTPDKSGAILGRHTVRITTPRMRTDDEGNEIELPQRVPSKYNVDSELSAVVNRGENPYDFHLESTEGEAPETAESAEPTETPEKAEETETPEKAEEAETPAQAEEPETMDAPSEEAGQEDAEAPEEVETPSDPKAPSEEKAPEGEEASAES